MKTANNNFWRIYELVIIFLVLFILNGCSFKKGGGVIPIYMDEYVSTTAERRIKLTKDIEGFIIKYQKAYDCNHEFYKYNATAIISYQSEFITIYDYCQQYEFKKGDKVVIRPTEEVNKEWTIREIFEPMPKSSENYGYWQCVSCKYKNSFGTIELIENK